MPAFLDLTGKRYGRLTVIERSRDHIENDRKRVCWKCLCDCGSIHITRGHSLTSGHALSCGCIRIEELVKRAHRRKDNRPETVAERKRIRTEKAYQRVLLDRYGLTHEQFQKMVEDQSNKCAICRDDMQPPYVDHNHSTGTVRKLLCRHCNWLLGQAKENVNILKSAIEYLETENGKFFRSNTGDFTS